MCKKRKIIHNKKRSKIGFLKEYLISFQKNYSTIIVISSIVVISFIIYSNTFNSPFFFDDSVVIVNNERIKSLTSFSLMWGRRFVGYVSFALNYYFNKYDPFGYHLVNIIIHMINGILVYFLVRNIFETPKIKNEIITRNVYKISYITSLIFVVHPIQTQSITYITQRFTSLATLFFLASILFYIKGRNIGNVFLNKKVLFFTISFLTGILAILTKESAYILPFVILLCELCFFKFSYIKFKKVLIYFLIIILILAFLFIILNSFFIKYTLNLNEILNKVNKLTREANWYSRKVYLFTQFNVIRTYIRLLIFPINQNFDYDYPISETFFEFKTIISTIFLGLVILFGYIMKKHSNLILFGILWFFINLIITSSAIPIRDVIFEHRLYLPSIGLILAFVVLADFIFLKLSKR